MFAKAKAKPYLTIGETQRSHKINLNRSKHLDRSLREVEQRYSNIKKGNNKQFLDIGQRILINTFTYYL